MGKSIKLKGDLFWDSTSLWRTLGEKPNITNGDLNDTKVMGTYYIAEDVVGSISNAPFTVSTALVVFTFNEAAKVVQRAYSSGGQIKERVFDGVSWSEWYLIPHFYSGTTPSADLGVDGDIFLKRK